MHISPDKAGRRVEVEVERCGQRTSQVIATTHAATISEETEFEARDSSNGRTLSWPGTNIFRLSARQDATGQRLEVLEAMRGFAAVWVVMLHGHLSTEAFLGELGPIPLLVNGFLGVDFFFVLSGFIIAYSSQRLIEQGRGLADYAQARLIRIYVPYLPVGVGLYFLYLALPSLSAAADRSPSLLTSITLLPSNGPPALSVAWTLVHELIFYALFSLAFVSRRVLTAGLALWGACIVVFALSDVELPRFWKYFLSPLNLCFLLGAAVFVAGRKWSMPATASVLAFLIGAAAVLGAASYLNPNRVVVAIGFALIVLAASSPLGARIRIWRWLVSGGAASYAIYLIHNPILSLMVRLVRHVSPTIQPWMGFAIICGVSTAAGLVYWRLYEKPTLRTVKALVSCVRGTTQ